MLKKPKRIFLFIEISFLLNGYKGMEYCLTYQIGKIWKRNLQNLRMNFKQASMQRFNAAKL